MKYCPICQTTYTDESLRFCLQDGTVLRSYAEGSLMPTQDFSEQETVARQTPDTSDWEQTPVTRLAAIQPEEKKSNTPLIVILTASVMLILFGGIVGIWLLLGGGSDYEKSSNVVAGKPINHATNANTVDRNRTENKNSGSSGDTNWEPINYNASLNGENLTYYRGTTPEQCQADCAANPKCKAFTLIRAGAYNASDPPMCYLASKVTGVVTHSCCISGIKKNRD
jgi:hypothetical protein